VFVSYKLPLGLVRKSRSSVREFDPILFDSSLRALD
jgi:hypothetical protein